MTNSTITLEGTQEQVLELDEAVALAKTVLFSLGGKDQQFDSYLSDKLQRLNYWSEHFKIKLP